MRAWQSIVQKITKKRPSAAAKVIILRDAAGRVSIEMAGSASSCIHAITECLVEDIEFNRAVLDASRRAQCRVSDSLEATSAINDLINETLPNQ